MSGAYKEVGGWNGVGWVVGKVGGWRRDMSSVRLFKVAMSPRSTSYSPDKPRGPKRCLTSTGPMSKPYLPSSALYRPRCLSHDFTRKADQLAKPGNATLHGWSMSIAIKWGNKMEYA